MSIIIPFIIAMAFLLFALIKLKITPGISLFTAAILMGFLARMDPSTILSTATSNFGSTLSSVGLIVLFGGAFGDLLGASGATEELAKGLLRKFGKKRDMLALNIAGFLVSIPVYFAAAYITLSPLVNSLSDLTKKKRAGYVAALAVGLIMTASVVAPTPGPVAVASQLGANLGWFILYGLVVALPGALIGGWLFGERLNKSSKTELTQAEMDRAKAQAILNDTELLRPDPTKPSALHALALILTPVVLILLRSALSIVLPEGSVPYIVVNFIGHNVFAIFVALLLAMFTLHKYLVPAKGSSISKIINKALNSYGGILLTLGCGGSFAGIIKACGLGDALVTLLSSMHIPAILAAYLLSLILHAAVGSGTVAMTTAVAIIGTAAVSTGLSPIAVGLAICCGGAGLTLPTDGAFWHASELNGISVKQSFTSITMATSIGSLVGFCVAWLLSLCAGFLPGL